MLYVDPRGEFECVSGDSATEGRWPSLAEECGRVTALVNSRQWTRAAISVTHRLLQAAQRVGDSSAWAYTVGRDRPWFSEDVKALTGSARVHAGALGKPALSIEKPARGRWLYDGNPTLLAIHSIRRYDVLKLVAAPTVAIWRWPDRSDTMLQAFCDVLGADAGVITVVLPDTPGLHDFALRYTARQRMTKTERTLLENLFLFTAYEYESPCYGRFGLTRVIEPGGEEVDGALVDAALAFLDVNYQVRISPWDLIRDPLLGSQLLDGVDAERTVRAESAPWTVQERAEIRDRGRAQPVSRALERWGWDVSIFSPHRPEPLGGP